MIPDNRIRMDVFQYRGNRTWYDLLLEYRLNYYNEINPLD